jgi:protein-tyrosine phosphatase
VGFLDCDAIDELLVVGSAFLTDDIPALRDLGVGAVVNLQAEASDPVAELESVGIMTAHVELEDYRAPTYGQLDDAVAAVRYFSARRRRVYLHCYAGLQRSVVVAACVYIDQDPRRWDARNALEFVCSQRRNACPLREQVEAVHDFERVLRAIRGL